MSFLTFVPFLSRSITSVRQYNSPTCAHYPPPHPKSPDGTPLPPALDKVPIGAQIEPTFFEKCLQTLRFGYESSTCTTPSTVRYRCARGHVIRSRLGSSACRVCPSCQLEGRTSSTAPGSKLILCDVRALASAKNGTLVSTEYHNARIPLIWRCQHNHVWKATVSNIRAGTWCPECARLRKKLSMHDMHQIARERGGQCLSTDYISGHVKLQWRCAEGHEFLLAPNNIRRKLNGARKPSWCKICAKKSRLLKPEQSIPKPSR